tara:strand:- start:76222 stop:76659 length:438 start_codon:yes stop_codon:yes gene_type:complete
MGEIVDFNDKDKLVIHHVGMVCKDMDKQRSILQTLDAISITMSHKTGDVNYKYIPEFKCNCILVGSFEFIIPDYNSKLSEWFEMSESPLHHIAVKVDDIKETTERLCSLGIPILSDKPVKGVANTLVNFIHPLHCGVMIEIVEEL